MSEMSDMFKLVNQMELAKKARVGMELTYFDVIELLGEIKSLYEYITELEAAQRWIPVSERLPELDQDVLAVVEGEIKVGHFYQELDFIEPDDDDEEGNIYFSAFDDGLLVATHWFPIPDGLEERER